ncbi:MAG: hypothetical protein L6422_01450 [Candidatus Marinimicrobia bacterium]|nr:hypothetical protein [bacterium]MCG2714946.1 hypothetical protein [Candidatus Neomarinimicrobiota bacterium]
MRQAIRKTHFQGAKRAKSVGCRTGESRGYSPIWKEQIGCRVVRRTSYGTTLQQESNSVCLIFFIASMLRRKPKATPSQRRSVETSGE